MDNDRLIGLRALSRHLSVPARWIREEAAQGSIPHLRAGSGLLFNLAAVEEALARRARSAGLAQSGQPASGAREADRAPD